MPNNEKKTLLQKLCSFLDIPYGILGKVSFTETAGNKELEISGCIGVIAYTTDKIVLRLCDRILTVCGTGLEFCTFAGGSVSIIGIIRTIEFGE